MKFFTYTIERIHHLNDEEDKITRETTDDFRVAFNKADRLIRNAERQDAEEIISIYSNGHLIYTHTVNPEVVTLDELLKR